ncbi:oxidoreductase C-terminal domain-containing protein [Sinomonas sp. P10A9]|uniref:Oxidoreductase C-terminal domain-containing protein n=1 Tax=Sinomonas puerhi TaxID=3238584 RepID=A0AB39L5W9_9MICC
MAPTERPLRRSVSPAVSAFLAERHGLDGVRLELGAAVDGDNGGITVDGALRTSDPRVFAIGDCASFPSEHAGHRVRLESVQNATDQGRHLAAVLLGQDLGEYRELPWFWTHQGRTKVQIAGIGRPSAHRIVRGDRSSGKFSVFSFDGAHPGAALLPVESVNSPGDHLAARRILEAGRTPSPADLADPSFDLKAYSRFVPLPA